MGHGKIELVGDMFTLDDSPHDEHRLKIGVWKLCLENS